MNKIADRPKLYTADEFCALIRDDQKADLIDGVIYMASPENTAANELFGWLFTLMFAFVEEKSLGKVYGSRVAFLMNETNMPEPDIAFIRQDRLHLVERGRVKGPPDLVIEIVSPESVERDYDKKRKQYQDAGVSEYWIIDELKKRATLLRLRPDGKYREVRPKKGELHSQALPGFWLRREWLWQPRSRKAMTALQEILSRQP